MSSQRFSSVQTKIYQLVFGLGFFLFGLGVTQGMMRGNKKSFQLTVGVSILAVILLQLNQYYWVLAAFLLGMGNGRSLPYVRFYGGELGAIVLASMFFARQALHRDTMGRSNLTFVSAAFPFMAWFCLVWALHPAGMMVLGGTTMGGRFYFLVVLAFLALFCFSHLSLGERESKWLVIAVCCGYLSFVLDILVKGGSRGLVAEGRTHYQLLRLSFVAPIFLCRYSIPEMLVRPRVLLPFLTCFGLSVWTGNRTAAARSAIVGLLAPFFLKRDKGATFAVFMLAAFLISIVAVGQGRVWNLPFSVQRSLSFLPAKWDRRLEKAGFQDEFRVEMRRLARIEIRRNPWMGRGGFAIDPEEMRWVFFTHIGRNTGDGHSLTGNWHNVWLGFAADFGIPLSVAWALFMGCFLVYGYRKFHVLPPGSWAQTAYLYFYLLGTVEFLNSFFQGGHSSITPATFFPWAGMMIAILNGNDRARSAQAPLPMTQYSSQKGNGEGNERKLSVGL